MIGVMRCFNLTQLKAWATKVDLTSDTLPNSDIVTVGVVMGMYTSRLTSVY